MDTADFGLDACLTRLLRETSTSVVLDVGANHGGFVDYVRGQGYEGRVLSFEPLPQPFATLERRVEGDSRWEAVQVAISDAPGRSTMRRSGRADVTSSLLATTDAMVGFLPAAAPGEGVEVTVSTIDEQVADRLSAADRPFLKIDTQGNELAVLEGAEQTLRRATGVLVELSLVELYEGQALYGEIIDWLTSRNHFLLAVAPAFHERATGRLLQLDALFGVLPVAS